MEPRDRFFNHVAKQLSALPPETVSSLIDQAGGPGRVVLVFVDILKGFCEKGPLASERVAGMVKPVKALAEALLKRGDLPAENLVFLNDTPIPRMPSGIFRLSPALRPGHGRSGGGG